MLRRHGQNGFTLLELVLALVILTMIASLALPRIGTAMKSRQRQRFLYSVATLSTECWRRAQLDGNTMHLLFDSLGAQVRWEEGGVGVPYPEGYGAPRTTSWLFGPDAPPANPTVYLYSSADTLKVVCLLSEQWNVRWK